MNIKKIKNFAISFSQLEEQINLEEICQNLIKDMNEYGVCVMDDFLGQRKGLNILEEVERMHASGLFKVS